MKNWLVALGLCSLQFIVYSQNPDSLPLKRFNLGISLLEDPALFTWQVNAMTNSLHFEWYTEDRVSVSFSLGYVGSLKPTPDANAFGISSVESVKGFKYQSEYRKYLNRTKRFIPAYIFLPHLLQFRSVSAPNTGYYAGFNAMFLHTVIQRRQEIPNEPLVPELYQVNRTATGVSLKAGYMCQYKSGFTLDLNFGFGVQYIVSNYSNRFIDPFSAQAQERELGADKLVDNGTKATAYFSSNLKLGWAF